MFVKTTLKNILPDSIISKLRDIRARFFNIYARESYSQNGEDMLLETIFGERKNGYYVDIGAHHPKRFSNTYIFYKKGWCGINIDAMPGSMALFKKMRPRDTNLEIAISEKKEILNYYIFDEPAVNTLSDKTAKKQLEKNQYNLVQKVTLQSYPLKEILLKYLPANYSIDFLNIDTEGLDFDVLKSNDWIRYRPNVVIVEHADNDIGDLMKDPLTTYMLDMEYIPLSKILGSVFFIEKNFLKRKFD